MSPLKTTPTIGGRFLPKFGLDSFRNKPGRGMTSINRKSGATSAFHQFGDAVSRTKSDERSNKIFGSINSAIKAGRAPLKPEGSQSKPKINSTFKPVI